MHSNKAVVMKYVGHYKVC